MRDYYMPETPITADLSATNADRIRAMSDEELVEFFDKKLDVCIDRGPPKEDCYTVGGCKKCILEWLRQTAEEG